MSPSRDTIEMVWPPFSRAASLFLERKITDVTPGSPLLLFELLWLELFWPELLLISCESELIVIMS